MCLCRPRKWTLPQDVTSKQARRSRPRHELHWTFLGTKARNEAVQPESAHTPFDRVKADATGFGVIATEVRGMFSGVDVDKVIYFPPSCADDVHTCTYLYQVLEDPRH
jgi:hypothetical protein